MRREIAEELAFNFRSYGRTGQVNHSRLTPAQARMVARTTARTPEVMVKVLSSSASSCKAVSQHLSYIGRKGEVGLHTDDGYTLQERTASGELPNDWNLDLDEAGSAKQLGRGTRAKPVRLIHKIVFSMPPGTNANKVLSAVQSLCQEEFALKHRYAMALHTDDDHPHVHVVLKARSEQGDRLNIKKAHLKEWRIKFAVHLREHGVPANATPRIFRGVEQKSMPLALIWQQQREFGQAGDRGVKQSLRSKVPLTMGPRLR